MKRLFYALLISGLSGSLAVSRLHANEMEEGMEHQHHEMGGKKMDGKMKEKLGLSEDQVKKLEAAKKARQEASKPLHEEIKKNMEKLRDQLKNKAGDKEIQVTLDQLEKSRAAMEAVNEKFKSETASFLTPTQRAQMLVGMMGRMKEGGRMMKGPRKERKHEHMERGERSEESED